jgi:hypothetical protein
MQEAALLDGASAGQAAAAARVDIGVSAASLIRMSDTGRGEMGDVFGERVLRTDAAGIDGAGLAGF